MIFKISKLSNLRMGFLIDKISAEIWNNIFVPFFTLITPLYSVKDWLVNIFPIAIRYHSMLCNLALHTKATTFQRVDCKEKLNLNGIFYCSN